jgi:hypothetical protein
MAYITQDPEMNKLGETGLRTAESKKKVREDKKNRANEMKELEAKLAAVEAERDALLQGGGSTARLDAQVGSVKDEIEEKKTPKKKPATKKRVKNESDDDGDEAFETMPAKKKRATKAKKEEDANLIKDEDEVDAPIAAPKKRAPRKKAVKAEDNASMFKEEEGLDDQTMTTAPKKRAPRGRKAVKEEPVDEQNVNDSGEPSEVNAPVKKGRKKAVKKELSDHMAVMRGIGSAAGVTDGSSLNTTIPAEAKTSAAIKGEPSDAVNVGVGSSSVVAVSAVNVVNPLPKS